MSGYKAIVLKELQTERWKEVLLKNDMEIITLDSLPQSPNARVEEEPFLIKHAEKEVTVLKYRKQECGQEGVVFLGTTVQEIEFADMIISLLKLHSCG